LVAPMIKTELTSAQKIKRADIPQNQAQVKALLDEVRQQGIARVVDSLLPGVVGFCAPVFDSDSHLALGMVSLGPASSFDANWQGRPAQLLRQAAQNLSHDLGH